MYVKQPAIKGGLRPCLCCGVITDQLSMDAVIAVRFGMASLSKDSEMIYMEMPDESWMTVKQAEKLAILEPYCDWRITLFGPMHGEVYQRHDNGCWVLIERNLGFA